MGLTYVKIRLSNPADLDRLKVVELLVDSGAMFTSIPRNVLEELGLRPVTRRKLRAYRGTVVERDLGGVVVEHEDRCA